MNQHRQGIENSVSVSEEADRGELAEALEIIREHGLEAVPAGTTDSSMSKGLEIVRCALSNILNPGARSSSQLEAEVVALAIGYPGVASEQEVANRHGISKQAISKRCIEFCEELGLPRSFHMRSPETREACRNAHASERPEVATVEADPPEEDIEIEAIIETTPGKITGVIPTARAIYTENSLSLPDDITDEEIDRAAQWVKKADDAVNWWMGDLLCEVSRLRGPGQSDASVLNIPSVSRVIERLGINKRTAQGYWRLCYFIPPPMRLKGAHYTHYREGFRLLCDTDATQRWVARAIREKMSTRKMAAAIRSEQYRECGMTVEKPLHQSYQGLSTLYGAKREILRLRTQEITGERLETLKADLRPLKTWLDDIYG